MSPQGVAASQLAAMLSDDLAQRGAEFCIGCLSQAIRHRPIRHPSFRRQSVPSRACTSSGAAKRNRTGNDRISR